MDIKKYLPLTEATYYILLSLTEPLHGYGIMQKVESLSRNNLKIAPGTLYGALENLKKQKLIQLDEENSEKRRKVYVLTQPGRLVLLSEYQRLQALVEVSAPILQGVNINENKIDQI